MKILRYGIKNFYSFKDEQIISFTMPKSISSSCFTYDGDNNDCVSPILCVMGHNGSGKTNLLKPLPFIAYFLNQYVDVDGEEEYTVPLASFMNDQRDSTEIFVEYEFENENYKYEVEFFENEVAREVLSKKRTSKYSYILKRTIKDSYSEVKIKNSDNYVKSIQFNNLSNKSSIIAAHITMTEEPAMMSYVKPLCRLLSTNIRQYGKATNNRVRIIGAAQRLEKNKERFDILKETLKQLDLGVDDIVTREIEYFGDDTEKSKLVKMPMGVHKKSDGSILELPMTRESSGTQALFIAIEQILQVIENGGIAVLDEVDSDLHPYMLKELLDLLMQQGLNTQNAQILFTSHSPEILNILNKYQVYFVEKSDCQSIAYRGSDVEGLRLDDNLYQKYMSGAIGGVPQI
jgi:AAA15 family ATPase/GTPase